MAHKTGGGSTRKNRDSISKRLGVKLYGGQNVKPGYIIVRQKGNKFYPGTGTKQGNDYTIFSMTSGKVEFKKQTGKTLVNIIQASRIPRSSAAGMSEVVNKLARRDTPQFIAE